MKILVLADTHLPYKATDFPEEIYKEAKEAELILHAGDICELEFLKKLEALSKVKAVYGNMDSNEAKQKLNKIEIITVGNFKIGLTHGAGSPSGLTAYLNNLFNNKKVDCIIYGHSHQPSNERIGDILYFNPGSPTDKLFAPYNSFGILEINNTIKASIVKIK